MEEHHLHGNLEPFHEMVMKLEEMELKKYLHLAAQQGLVTENEIL